MPGCSVAREARHFSALARIGIEPGALLKPFLLEPDENEFIERVSLGDLRPTQMAVGMRAVEAKRRKIERRAGRGRKLRRYLEKRTLPAVLGPKEDFYIIDHHHLSLALLRSDVDDAFVRIVADFSDLSRSAFHATMESLSWLHPYDANGKRICASRLPRSIDRLESDRFRDLAWSVREAGGFRKTNAPFSEFAWANFFRGHLPRRLLSKDFEHAHEMAMSLATSRDARLLPGYVGRH